MNKQKVCMTGAVILALVFTLLLTGTRVREVEAKVHKTQEALAEEVFRFHVTANSDDPEDQELKLKVRDAVIARMKTEMGKAPERSVEATRRWAWEHLDEIEETARDVIRREGFRYDARAEVTRCYFPDKRYGDLLFPAGTYQALKISLGNAGGQNWWCVLYPALCFTDPVCAVVDEDGKKELEEALSEEEYEMITASTKFKIKWFFFGGSWND